MPVRGSKRRDLRNACMVGRTWGRGIYRTRRKRGDGCDLKVGVDGPDIVGTRGEQAWFLVESEWNRFEIRYRNQNRHWVFFEIT